jgi:peptide chain release factor 2
LKINVTDRKLEIKAHYLYTQVKSYPRIPMLYDDILEKTRHLTPDIEVITTYWEKSDLEDRYQSLKKLSKQENFWEHPDQAIISKELQQIQSLRETYLGIVDSYNEYKDLIELFKTDETELKKLAHELDILAKKALSFKIALLLNQPEDRSPCFITINSGAGGTESQDWAHMLLRMYLRYCEKSHLSAQVMDMQQGEEAGIKSATLYIKGKNAYGLLKGEQGIHRLVRISPFDANKRRHTSFAAVSVMPERPEVEIVINPQDLRIDTYRAGGAGGQHVNKTDSAVRITHLPTNIVVQCQNERSQLQNKETALKMLKAKLIEKQKEEEQTQKSKIEKKKIEWGSQIRSYILHPYKLVKDHRTNFESPQPELVLDGYVDDFIQAYLSQVHD